MISTLRLGLPSAGFNSFGATRLRALLMETTRRIGARIDTDWRLLLDIVAHTPAGMAMRSKFREINGSKAVTAARAYWRARPIVETPIIEDRREWSLATAAVGTAADITASAGQLQSAAALQIDAAVYALDGLLSDLRHVMDISALYPTVVHSLDTGSSRRAAMARGHGDSTQGKLRAQHAA